MVTGTLGFVMSSVGFLRVRASATGCVGAWLASDTSDAAFVLNRADAIGGKPGFHSGF